MQIKETTKKAKKKSSVSNHMKQFGLRYNPRFKILTTQTGEILKKYAHGYFDYYSFHTIKLSREVQMLLKSYPQWFLSQSNLRKKQFQDAFKIMKEAHPEHFTIIQDENKGKESLFKRIDHIRFAFIKRIDIRYRDSVNIEPISWLEAPLLQHIAFQTDKVFCSVHSFSKTNFRFLRIITLTNRDKQFSGKRNIDLSRFSRTRFISREQNPQSDKFSHRQNQISIFRRDASDIAILCKSELRILPNFRIVHIQSANKALSLNMRKIAQTLNRKFLNKTIQKKVDQNQNFHWLYDSLYQPQLDFGQIGLLGYGFDGFGGRHHYDYDDDNDGYYNEYTPDYDQNGYDPVNLGYPQHYDDWNDDF